MAATQALEYTVETETWKLSVTQADIEQANTVRMLPVSKRPDGQEWHDQLCPIAQAMRREWELPHVSVGFEWLKANNGVRVLGATPQEAKTFIVRWDNDQPVRPIELEIELEVTRLEVTEDTTEAE